MIKLLKVILFIIPWFLSSIIFCDNISFYNEITLPFFAPSTTTFQVIWTIIYILIGISSYLIYSKYPFKTIPTYNKSLFYNFIFNQSFCLFTFVFQNLFLSFAITIFNFVTSLFLFYETKELDNKANTLLIPYIYFNLFTCILSLVIYFINL